MNERVSGEQLVPGGVELSASYGLGAEFKHRL